MPATHPMALEGNGDLELASLLEHPVIVSSRASAVRRALDTALYEQGAPLRPAFESQSEAMAQALAAAGHGVCVVADHPQFDLSVRPLTGQGRPLAISLYAGFGTPTTTRTRRSTRPYSSCRAGSWPTTADGNPAAVPAVLRCRLLRRWTTAR